MAYQLAIFLAISTTLINILLGVMIILRGFKNPASRVFSITVVAIIVWALTNFAFLFPLSKSTAVFLSKSAFFAAAIIAGSFLYFSLTFTKSIISPFKKIFIAGTTLLICVISFTDLIVEGIQPYIDIWGQQSWVTNEGPFHIPYAVFFIGFMAISFFILGKKIITASTINKLQIQYILIGAIIATVGGAIMNLFIPIFTGDSFYGIFGPYFTIFFVGFTAYAILKYRFLDIRVVFRKGTVYAATLAIIIGLYAYLVFVISQTTSSVFKIGGDITSVFIIILVAVGFHPLRKLVEHTINEYIFVKRIDLRAAAEHLNNSLASKATNFENLLKTLRQELKTNLECDSVDLAVLKAPREYEQITLVSNDSRIERDKEVISHLKDGKEVIVAEELEFLIQEANDEEVKNILNHIKELCARRGIAAIVPILTSDDLIGIMILGPKKNKAIYSAGDIKFLDDLKQRLSFILGGMILYYQALERIKRDNIRK